MVGYALGDPVHSMAARDGCYVVLIWYSGIDAVLVQVGDPLNSLKNIIYIVNNYLGHNKLG